MTTAVRRAACALLALAVAYIGLASPALADRGVLEAIRARGECCAASAMDPRAIPSVNAQGSWSGISVDFCRALAAAVLGSKDAVEFRPLSAGEGSRRCRRARSTCCRATSP